MRSRGRARILVALALLYVAQGIPFGFATEYLPVVLREARYSYASIAALSWLQLPWQLKIFWAKAADHPRLRARARVVILAMQLGLTATVAAFAVSPLRDAPTYWFVLTAVAAALAATQDVFVDAFAVRVLRPEERGLGNTAQVGGYRVGMLVGGAALLMLIGVLGERVTLLACAGVVAAASFGAFAGSTDGGASETAAKSEAGPYREQAPHEVAPREEATPDDTRATPLTVRALLARMFRREAIAVSIVALTFKLGLHMASSLIKPMTVDFGWSKSQIGGAVVVFGTLGALAGSVGGGLVHRLLAEKKALVLAAALQALVILPFVVVHALHAPFVLTAVVIAVEHFASGLGTTVLFAALMSATRPADAGLHYTILTSLNALAIGLGGLFGGIVADHAGMGVAFSAAAVASALPILVLRRWDEASRASRAAEAS